MACWLWQIAVTSVGVRAQDIPVSGVVKDKSNNSTLPYASVNC